MVTIADETEEEGFEPSVRSEPYTGFRNRPFQPLRHPSDTQILYGTMPVLQPEMPKKFVEQDSAFFSHQSFPDSEPVIQAKIVRDSVYAPAPPETFVASAEDKRFDSCRNESTCAHHARFKSHVKRRSFETVSAKLRRRVRKHDHLRMGQARVTSFDLIARGGQDSSLFRQDGSDRNFATVRGFVCLSESFRHTQDVELVPHSDELF